MTQKSLVDEIITIIKSEANNNPAPERCRIRKVYPDKVHADIETRHGLLKYVDVVGYNPKLGDNAIIIYLDEDYKDYVVVADTVDEVVDIVTSWEATLSDEKVPSEKLTKTELDKKIAKSNTTGLVKNDGSIDTTSYSTFSGSYGDLSNKPSYTATVTSSTTGAYEIGTINVSGSSQTIYGKDTGGTSVDIVTSWESTPSDSKVASEKLVKDSLDAKQATLTSGTNIKTVNSTSLLGSGDITIPKGDDGSLFWTTTTAPTTPNYTFTIANLTGETGKTPKKGDIIFYSYYRYTVDTVGTTTLKATPRQSIRGSTGAAGAEGATGNGISSITKTGTSGLVDTYTITYTNTDTDTFTVTNGSDATVTIVDDLTSDSSTSVLSAKQGKVLNTNKIETSAIATSFGSTTSDSKVPSEKLAKSALDNKLDKTHSSYKGKNVVTNASTGAIEFEDKYSHPSTKQCNYSYTHPSEKQCSYAYTHPTSKQCNASIPSSSSDLSDGSSLVKTSNTVGLLKNDGSVDTSSYITSSALSGYQTTGNLVTSFSSTTSDSKYPSEKLVKTELDKKIATSSTTGLVKNDGSIDTSSYITSSALSGYQTTANLVTSFSSTTSDSKYPSEKLTKTELDKKITKSNSATGLLKDDGTVMTSGTSSSNWAVGNHTHSAYVNPTKVTSWSSTPSDDNVASEKLIKDSLDGKQATLVSGTSIKTINSTSLLGSGNISTLTSSDIADNLTTNDSTKVLSAKQGKALADLIGSAITYINQ